MANNIKLNGIIAVDGTKSDFKLTDLSNDKAIYFVRTDDSGESGYLYFNGKKYGKGGDVSEVNAGEY